MMYYRPCDFTYNKLLFVVFLVVIIIIMRIMLIQTYFGHLQYYKYCIFMYTYVFPIAVPCS